MSLKADRQMPKRQETTPRSEPAVQEPVTLIVQIVLVWTVVIPATVIGAAARAARRRERPAAGAGLVPRLTGTGGELLHDPRKLRARGGRARIRSRARRNASSTKSGSPATPGWERRPATFITAGSSAGNEGDVETSTSGRARNGVAAVCAAMNVSSCR